MSASVHELLYDEMMFHKLPDEAKTSLSSMIPRVPP